MTHAAENGRLQSAAASARADRYTMDVLGIPSILLMERAALAVAHEIVERFVEVRDVVVLCGPGNNGGDGLAVARLLHGWGLCARVHLCSGRHNDVVDEQIRLAKVSGVEVLDGNPEGASGPSTLVVDALLGTGAKGAPRGQIESAIRWLLAAKGPRVAIDLPTGVSPDSGATPGIAATVDLTVTMQHSKPGLHITPGRDHSGVVVIADIGLSEEPGDTDLAKSDGVELVSPWVIARLLSAPADPRHKGERGHVGVIAGSPGTTGAAILAATAALRSGAGLVTVSELAPGLGASMISARPELMIEPLSPGTWGARPLSRASVLIVGPGLTRACDRRDLATLWRDDPRPAIWDASALDELPAAGDEPLAGPRIITPHPGEARRLLSRLGDPGERSLDPQAERRLAARALARVTGAVVVLKGAGSLIDDGSRLAIAISGGPGLATAGSGDCLTGFIAALVARGLDPFMGACAGVHLHGVAGELAVADHPGALALDIAEYAGPARVVSPTHRRWPLVRRA